MRVTSRCNVSMAVISAVGGILSGEGENVVHNIPEMRKMIVVMQAAVT